MEWQRNVQAVSMNAPDIHLNMALSRQNNKISTVINELGVLGNIFNASLQRGYRLASLT